jgi:hypothetical protein
MRQSISRLRALHDHRNLPDTVDALTHALLAALQEIAVLKTLLSEKQVWDNDLYRKLKVEAMLEDHSAAGPWPNTQHSYYPYFLDDEEYLRSELHATDEEVSAYRSGVEYRSRLT